MDISQLIRAARERRASDIHLTHGRNPIFRIDGTLVDTEFSVTNEDKDRLIYSLLNDAQRALFDRGEDVDLCYE
ncbi:MAG: type IV pili twitching motility protein PilT, partial [Defluviitaleaceae bacterium]|nr:type IV pili twitching motility protein PilT [Defluviitaleaceae bacterium]